MTVELSQSKCITCDQTHLPELKVKGQTHSDSLRVRLCDDAAGFQVEVSDAASHGEPPIHVGLAGAVPRHEAAELLDPEHTERVTAVTVLLTVGKSFKTNQ